MPEFLRAKPATKRTALMTRRVVGNVMTVEIRLTPLAIMHPDMADLAIDQFLMHVAEDLRAKVAERRP